MKTVEGPLSAIGTIFIVLGCITGIIYIFLSIVDGEFLYFAIGLSAIFSGFVSGYLFKGIANIIDLLISLKSSFNKEHDGSRSWAEISDSIKKK